MTSRVIVQQDEELRALCKALAGAEAFCLDTEFVRERTFYIQLGIIQIASGEIEAVIDPLSISSLEPLYELISDASIEKVVHAGEQDFAALYERGQIVPRNVFDTQIASALVGYGDQISYAKLVAKVTGVQLKKLETLTDWTARPLTQAQIDYSLDDVRYLSQIREHLGQRLAELGRAGWEREECQRLEDPETYRLPPPEEYYRRLKTGGLNATSLGILREVTAFREETARSRNLPRGWVMRDQTLIEIARRKPHSPKSLRQIRSLKPQQVSKDGDAILTAVREGEQHPIEEPPPDKPRLKAPPQLESVARFLEAWLYARADAAQIAPSMLATRVDLKTLVTSHHNSELPELPLLEGWRRDLVGQDLVDLLDGKLVLKLDERGRISAFPFDASVERPSGTSPLKEG
jgi:ribonuclease D